MMLARSFGPLLSSPLLKIIGQRLPRRQWLLLLSSITLSASLLWGVMLPFAAPVASAQTDPAIAPQMEQLSLPTVEEVLPSALNSPDTEPVYLDGRTLFSITSADGLSASARAKVITERLQSIARQLGQRSVQVVRTQDPASQLPILSVNDRALMTITQADAQLAGVPNLNLVAREFKTVVENALQQYRQERQPSVLRRQGVKATISLVLLLGLNFGLTHIQKRLRKKQRQLQKADAVSEESGASVNHKDLLRHISQKQSQTMVGLQRWLCRLGQGVLWGGGLLFLLNLFPYTRQWWPFILDSLTIPLQISAIGLVIYGLIRFGHVLVDRLFFVIQKGATYQKQRSQRLALRFSTISSVTKNVIATLVISIGTLAILSRLGLDLGPLLAGAGIISLALSFASQNVLKDVINGFLILLEDQFGVGDVIIVGDVAGFVENMNLRITQLRNEEGRLITIPNSQIAVVQNLSKEWSRVDLLIPVALNADLNQAIALIDQVAEKMRRSPDWSKEILEPPLVLGVDHLDHGGATVRLWIKTRPLKQWDVAREYRRRLKLAFDEAQISIGIPQQSLLVHQFDAGMNGKST